MAGEAAPPPSGVAARRAAYRAVRRVHQGGSWSAPAVDRALREASLHPTDRAFGANLAFETLRWEGTLDWALRRVVRRPLEAVQPEALDVLRLGAWQLLFSRAPDRAVVDTAARVARAEVGDGVVAFVNGCLRGLARSRPSLPSGDADHDLAIALGYPEWVVAAARERFGARARAVLAAGNRPPGVTLRAASPGARDGLLAELRSGGVDASAGRLAPEAVRAPGAHPGSLAAVAEGRATVQDEASMVVARVTGADLPGGSEVLDACAGPGGKSTHLAALGHRVTALDVHDGRARLVRDAAARLGVGATVRVAVADATRPPLGPGAVTAALVDAPCTGLGTVRRRPEVRWRQSPDALGRLARLQLGLLEAAAKLVAPGGRLVYSVCTWTQAETADVVEAFLAGNGDRFRLAVSVGAPPAAGGPDAQLDPDAHETDGMYVATLTRSH